MKPIVAVLVLLVPVPVSGGLISEPFVGQYTEDFDDGKFDAPGVDATTGYLRGDNPWMIGADLVYLSQGGIAPGMWFTAKTDPPFIWSGLAFSFEEPASQVGVTWKDIAVLTSEVRARLIAPDGSVAGDFLLDVSPGKFFGFESAAGISRLEISAFSREDAPLFTLDDLTYNAVPEPSTIALLAFGMMGLFGRRCTRT